ncbi:Transient receptor potential cation channel subfamily A member 1-like [Mizuhopecten yessoensis]|uniref:Transient receptor potential cation channel subfamily A member 1-like n=1 Tax=Mizuhopecten yessoensis TaxID=6573 RepID=A0A210QEG8_MIZYE|nr:Transient receptor potential cation channel subfamily A member 1-like [Mizuhopecten yessoensis]
MTIESEKRRHRRANSDGGRDVRVRMNCRKHRRPLSIPLRQFDSIVLNDDGGLLDSDRFHVSPSQTSMVADLGDVAMDDSFQREVAEKTRLLFIGKQEAEIEVFIDRIIAREGNKDRALLHVVSTIDNEPRVQMLINTLLHRGANPSASDQHLRTPLHYAVEKDFKGVCVKLLEHDAWPNARDHDNVMPYTTAYDIGNDDVASLLILYMPNIEVRQLYTSDGNKAAEFSFHTLLRKNMQKTVLAVLDCMIDHHSPSGHVRVYYQVLDGDEEGRSPLQDGFNRNSKSSLQILAKEGNKNIVYHDVVRLLIRRKWKKYARLRFELNALVYFVTLIAMIFSAIVSATSPNPLLYDSSLQIGRGVCEAWTICIILMTLFQESNQLRKQRLEYWTDAFNWIDMSSALLLATVVPLRITERSEQWPFFSIGFLLWTLRIFKYAAVFRQTGAYAQILWRILVHDFLQFTIVFTVMLLAFSGSFILALRGEDSLNTHHDTNSFWNILFLGVRILIEAERIIEYTELPPMSCILMVLFLFTCCVVLLNILIAQFSDTYQHVQQDAQRGLEVNRAWIVARVELNSFIVGKGHRTNYYKEYEDVCDIKHVLERWESPPLNEMNKNIQDIWESLQSHKLNVITVHNRLARQETSLIKLQLVDFTKPLSLNIACHISETTLIKIYFLTAMNQIK